MSDDNPFFHINLDEDELDQVRDLVVDVADRLEDHPARVAFFLGMVFISELIDFCCAEFEDYVDPEEVRLQFAEWFLAHPSSQFNYTILQEPTEEPATTSSPLH